MALTMLVSGCMFTGIENTGRIKLSKEDLEAERKVSDEDRLMQPLSPLPLPEWIKGRSFLGASDRVGLIFQAVPYNPYGKTLYYDSYRNAVTPLGKNAVEILFRDSVGREYVYQRENKTEGEITSADIPMLIDLSMVAKADSLLRGKTVWPRVRQWDNPEDYDSPVAGSQLLPVTVLSVIPNTADFPLRVVFQDRGGKRGSLVFNPDNKSSRSFSSQFFLHDPRNDYKNITDERWLEICNGRLAVGMTKQEARLAYGSPDNIESGHDYSKVIELWSYSNGIFLRFEDGLLVSFRK